MQHLNNDMDELFRKAAEDYSLNTGSADWEKVNAKLMESVDQDVLSGKKRDRRWMILLLLPMAFLCNRLSDDLFKEQQPAAMEHMNAPTPVAPPTTTSTSKLVITNQRPAQTGNRIPPAFSREPVSSAGTIVKNTPLFRPVGRSGRPVAVASLLPDQNATTSLVDKQNEGTTIIATEQTLSASSSTIIADDLPATTEKQNHEMTALPAPDTASAAMQEVKAPEKKSLSGSKRRFFVSVVAGPDVSTVKFKQFSKVGLQAGILVGYALNKRLALEAGVLRVRKNYRSGGDDFNKSKLYLPPNTKLVAVNGNCRMLEFPVALRYTLTERKKQAFFTSAGLSSYLMQAENYAYDYLYQSNGYVARYQKTYKNQSRNWAAVMQLTAGFMSRLGSIGQLRVEPYYAVPLKGIGYGELPLSSFGLRVGITSDRF